MINIIDFSEKLKEGKYYAGVNYHDGWIESGVVVEYMGENRFLEDEWENPREYTLNELLCMYEDLLEQL